MFDLPGQRNFRAFSWWTEAEIRWRSNVAKCTAAFQQRALSAVGFHFGQEEAGRRKLPFRDTLEQTIWGEPSGNEPSLEGLSDSDDGSEAGEEVMDWDLLGSTEADEGEDERKKWRMRKLREMVQDGDDRVVWYTTTEGGERRMGAVGADLDLSLIHI